MSGIRVMPGSLAGAVAGSKVLQGWRLAGLGAILLAVFLRVVNLGEQSLWYDEAFSWVSLMGSCDLITAA